MKSLKLLATEPVGNGPLRRSRLKWKNTIKINLKEMGGMDLSGSGTRPVAELLYQMLGIS
jgi:hypothetical protein